jgi:hypothetical protein
MVDWMIEVLSSFNCTTNTFFVSLDIMDLFFARCQRALSVKEIHLIGVTAMLIASKQEEIIPFKVSTVVDKMTHGKIRGDKVVQMELEILCTIGFNPLQAPSLFVLIETLLVKADFHKTKGFSDVIKVVTYISKMVMHDLGLLERVSLKYLAASCVYICLKIVEQVHREYNTKKCVEKLRRILGLDEQIFF